MNGELERYKFGQVAGADVFLVLYPDPWASPEDDDGLTPKQVEAWRNDEWFYVTAEVEIAYEDATVATACYGGIEYGLFTYTNDDDEIQKREEITAKDLWEYVGEELKGEAMSRALENIEKLIKWREAVACLDTY